MNALAKRFGVWTSTILTWIRRDATDHAEQPAPNGKAIVLELDEMWAPPQKKWRKRWIGKALDRDTGRLLAWECGRRPAATLTQLVNRLAPWEVTVDGTDHWPVYAAVIPPERLGMSKARTDGIERNHRRQRHGFGRFKRDSIMVSKARDMVDLTRALFARVQVNGNVAEIFTLAMITETILSN
jgi:IS1 family transposase